MICSLVASALVMVVFFGLIALAETPSRPSALSDNPSGRPPPTKRYGPEPSKRPLKPSKLPELPTIPAPAFKSLKGPYSLPTVNPSDLKK